MSKYFKYVNDSDGLDYEVLGYESSDFSNVGGAGSEDKPALLDENGLLDNSMINASAIDHNDLSNRDNILSHSVFLDLAGTRAMTGNLNLDSNRVVGLATPVDSGDAVSKAYADALAVGARAKGNVAAASVGNLTLENEQTVDGIALVAGDRVLVKDQTDPKENGIYVVVDAGAWVRSEDLDNAPQAEILNGVLVPSVLAGTVNAGKPFYISSVGTGVDGMHIIGTDNIVWGLFTSPTQLQAGDGISFVGNVVNVDLLDTDSGLTLAGAELAVDWATAITDNKAWKASDLTAGYVPIVDAGGFTDQTQVEGALQELYGLIKENGVIYTVGTGGVTKGDLVKISGNDTVLPYSDVTNSHRGIGLALTTELAAAEVKVLANDTKLLGVLTGATAGTPYYWDGSALVTTLPSGTGSFVWQVGIAANATDLHVEVRYIKKNV